MTTPDIIGISGYMRTGKDSVARLLIEQFRYKKLSFADPLRKMALDIDPYISLRGAPTAVLHVFGYEEDMFGHWNDRECVLYSKLLEVVGYERAKEVPDFRRFIQRLGTEGVRGNFGDNAWVDLAKKTIQNELSPNLGGPRWVLPDVRFPNEAKMVKDLGGVVWRTERPGFGGGEHPSEAMVAEITPDVIMRADSLTDYTEVDPTGHGKDVVHKGLARLVYENLGKQPDWQAIQDWANVGVAIGV